MKHQTTYITERKEFPKKKTLRVGENPSVWFQLRLFFFLGGTVTTKRRAIIIIFFLKVKEMKKEITRGEKSNLNHLLDQKIILQLHR